VKYAEGGGPDPRCYKVDCSKIAAVLPEFQPKWTVRLGMEQLHAAFQKYSLSREEFICGRYLRIKQISRLMQEHRLTDDLRWTNGPLAAEKTGQSGKPATVAGSSLS
jgi:hypothetical protein